MIDLDVKALAKLARLEVSAEELAKLEQELPGILQFVDTIQKAQTAEDGNSLSLRNVVRVDENPHESGAYTEALLKAAPAREGDRIAVRQVVSRKKSQGKSASDGK